MSRTRLPMAVENYRACIEGRKTQTRRVIVPQPPAGTDTAHRDSGGTWLFLRQHQSGEVEGAHRRAPYGVGDVVGLTLPHWRRQSYNSEADAFTSHDDIWDEATRVRRFRHAALDGHLHVSSFDWALIDMEKWSRRPAIFMPRWACLHEVRIEAVLVDRLQNIGLGGCIAEGVDDEWIGGHKASYHQLRSRFWRLWNSINAKRGYAWESNPWVWIYTCSPPLAVDTELRNDPKLVNSRNG